MPWYDEDGIDWGSIFGNGEDPYANWGGGAGGDGFGDGLTDPTGNETDPYEQTYQNGDSDGSDNSPTNPNSPNFDVSQIGKILTAAGIKPGAGANALGDAIKALGLGNNGLASLLPLLLAGGGAFNANNATNKASQQLQDAAKQANQQATDLIGGARQDFQPWMQAGVAALPQLQAMVGSNNLAGKFGPINSAAFSPISNFSPIKGAMTLADLAKRK